MTNQQILNFLSVSLAIVVGLAGHAQYAQAQSATNLANCPILFSPKPKEFTYSKKISIRPRIGLETETSRMNENRKQVLFAPKQAERDTLTKKILKFWQSKMGGTIKRYEAQSNGEGSYDYLQTIPNKASEFRVDADWASDLKEADAFELVTAPLDSEQIRKFIDSYEEFLKVNSLGAGIKTSQQFNIELRELIPGFSLGGIPSEKMGVSYNSIKDVNISKVVDLFLFFETHVLEMYAAIAPKRLGNIVNHFQVPMIFEQEGLLKELAALPVESRTYQAVRNIFVKYNALEVKLNEYGKRTSWKYRPFNIRKFFEPGKSSDFTWLFPALELRIPDTVETGEGLHKLVNLVYAAFNVGSNVATTPEMISARYQKYRAFFDKNRSRLPFQKTMRVLNQDIALQIYNEEFRANYDKFLKTLGLRKDDYVPFFKAEPSTYVSQTYNVFNMIGEREEVTYAGRKVKIPRMSLPQSFTKNISFGLEFEYSNVQGLKDQLAGLKFLEPGVSVEEATGNHEVRSLPTSSTVEMFAQIQLMRDLLGENLRSIHMHLRTPKSIYENMERPTFDAWIGRMSDWVTSLRASYRQGRFAFRTRTQSRMRVDTPNSWIENDKNEYRGTMRVLVLGEELDIEIRGLMDGVFSQNEIESDQFIVSTLILLTGLNHPELIEGQYLNRIAMEVADPSESLKESLEQFAHAVGGDLQSLPNKLEDLVAGLRLPNLMMLPLVGFHYSPLLSSHDIKKIQNANLSWHLSIWNILRDGTLNKEKAQEKFYESLKEWTRKSGIEDALFDSLLVRPVPEMSWAQLNLPKVEFHAQYLNKLVGLEGSEFARASINLFLASWLHKDEKSFFTAATQLDESKRKLLVAILAPHETTRSIRALEVKLAVDAPKKIEPKSFETNLMFLINSKSKLSAPIAVPPSPTIAATPRRAARDGRAELSATMRPNSAVVEVIVTRLEAEVLQAHTNIDHWSKLAVSALRAGAADHNVLVASLQKIFDKAAPEISGCIAHSKKPTFENIKALYRSANIARMSGHERLRIVSKWIEYAAGHVELAYSRGDLNHIRETLVAVRAILSYSEIENNQYLHSWFRSYDVATPQR